MHRLEDKYIQKVPGGTLDYKQVSSLIVVGTLGAGEILLKGTLRSLNLPAHFIVDDVLPSACRLASTYIGFEMSNWYLGDE